MINKKVSFNWTKECVYFFGYLWSDGYIDRTRTVLEIVEDDAVDIVNDIKKIEFLNIHTTKRKRMNRKPQMSIYFCDVDFYDSFMCKYFTKKSLESPFLLLNIIPIEYHRYFFLGLIDGDGCFYFNKNTRQFYITSGFDQDWTHIIKLFGSLNISQFECRKVENKNGNKSSYIRIKKHSEILSLFNYLYPDSKYEIGLKRKFLKCKKIIDNPPIRNSNKSKIDVELLKSLIDSKMNIYQISEKLDCSWRKVHNFCKLNNIKKPIGFYKS